MSHFWHVRWLIPLALAAVMAYQAVFSTAPLIASTDFVKRTPNFGILLPAGRVTRTEVGLKLEAEPIYFDVKLPVRVATVELELTTTAESAPGRIGVRQGGGWDYYFPEYIESSSPHKTYKISINEFKYVEVNHAQRFLISAPGLSPGGVTVTGARATIYRSPFDLDKAIESLTAKLSELWQI